ncbi:hypothetical protein GSI_11666 [Ganoderma sinense ZZ0214-1]|uniref:Uncharacterized protein n=1 Tax=Ganoderma sinense ZZ0214-1 TaxID=1077348 RepID=A0A2G8RWM4_9APHY|nr:hypothetical protein GSI_11666 [Ganoderma sinense ZZ0214-1]
MAEQQQPAAVAAYDRASPAKKRKLMHAPEGFEVIKSCSAKAPARKFASAFNDPKRSKMTPKDSALRLKGPSKPAAFQSPSAGPSKRPSLRVLYPPTLLPDPPQAGPSKVPPAPPPPGKSVAVRPMKPPSFPSTSSSASKFTLKNHIPVLAPKKSLVAKPKASIQEFRPPPPPPAVPPKTGRSISAIQPLPPPLPRKGPPLPDASKLKTISTTRVALATDPRTESGTSEILALQLGQAVSSYIPPAQRELNRGLGQSPEKASKAKSAKYIRGGLADRTQRLFAQQNTRLALWYKDMELQVQRPEAHTPVAPDLCLRIFEVAHVTSIASLQRSQNVPRLSIVKCAKIVGGRTTGDLTVLLDFGFPGSASAKAHTLDEVKEGRDLQIWAPWNSSDSGAEELRRFGALPRDGTTLFCTRFRIV